MGQFVAILPVILGNIRRRPGSSLVMIIGVAGVVAVLLSILAMAQGLHRTFAATGAQDRAIILAKGAPAEGSSVIPRGAAQTVIAGPGIRKGPDGEPIVSREILVQLRLAGRDGTPGVVTVRGVDPQPLLRPEIKLLQGRMVRPGLKELIAGHALLGHFPSLTPGASVVIDHDAWTIVGTFISGGAHDSEMLGDTESLLSATHRANFQSLTLALESPAALPQLKAGLEANPSLGLEAQREDQFYAARGQTFVRILTIVGNLVGGIMAIGAVFAALNTMYTAVASQAALIATLRAIGFRSLPVLAAVFTQALLLGVTGALLGALIAALLFGGYSATAASNSAQMIYTIRITPGLGALGVIWSLIIGALGSLPPAIRAARLPVAQALRES